MIAVDFHTHTHFSGDGAMSPRELIEACRKQGLDRVVVTDHNTIEGALRAKEIDPQLVIVGEEIKTSVGELLAAFVTEEVPKGLPPLETIERLRKQGAFISVSHPFDPFRHNWPEGELLKMLPYIDAIETFNSRCLFGSFNEQAQAFARAHDLAGTAGSDAHTLPEVGAARLLLSEFKDRDSLRDAIHAAQRKARTTGVLVHYASWKASQAKNVKKGQK